MANEKSRPPARTRGLKQSQDSAEDGNEKSRPPARTRGLKLDEVIRNAMRVVASSREDAWIETGRSIAMSTRGSRVLPRGRVD